MQRSIMLMPFLLSALRGQAQMPLPSYAAKSNIVSPSADASTYVPIESWVYSAIDALASADYVETAFTGLRPWTRLECARLIAEAEERENELNDVDGSGNTVQLMKELRREFMTELGAADGSIHKRLLIEAIDFRSTSVIGVPVTDSFHSAQTLVNDYGRPYGQGDNLYAGLALRAVIGHFAAYFHAEVQRATSASLRPASADEAIALADFAPTAAAGSASGFSRARVLEGYVAFGFHHNQLTFGKQAMWWGPSRGGPMLFSNNAEPITMLRYDRVSPFKLPGLGHWLGPIRLQAFAGRLSGQQFTHVGSQTFGQAGQSLSNQPFIHGQKVSFKPTPNFEFGVSRTVIFAGAGAPLTTRAVLRSLFSSGTSNDAADPGDRRSAVDVQYRLPKLRKWLTVYVDTFTDDEPFPLSYPTESAWSPGLHLTHFPGLPRLDLRAEGYLSPHRELFSGFYYFNVHYLSGYTNQRQLLGSWIGRESNGYQIWSRWWLSPRSTVEASFRHITQSSTFLHGGNLTDISAKADFALNPEWQLSASVQRERWWFPLLSATSTHNVTATFQLSYRPWGGAF